MSMTEPTQLGPYRIIKALGRGGMGAVYEAVHVESEERAAVKVLAPALAADPVFRERFGMEIESLIKLKHPSIVEIYAYGEEEGQLWYAMEMVDGRNLYDELRAGRFFHWREVTRIGIEICTALKHAHDRGVIHRDLKPANLLMTDDEHIKLTDFGIAKLYGATQITAENGVLGTADYMAPEQAAGQRVTVRTDLYSVGSLMFALLARRPPFASRTIPEVIHKLRYEDPPPIRNLTPDVPEEFEVIINQLLAKDPQDRIPTALALSNRLRAMDFALSVETMADRGEPPDSTPAGEPPDELGTHNRPTATISGTHHADKIDYSIAENRETIDSVAAAAVVSDADEAIERRTHFTRVDEQERQRAEGGYHSEEETAWWIKVAGLVVVLAGLASLAWYATRPQSPDKLYDRIAAIADDGETSDLLSVEDEIRQFIAQFPTDPRSLELKELQEELQLYRLQRRFQRRARRLSSADTLSSVEHAYLIAINTAQTDPEMAVTQLEALIDLFGDAPDAELHERQCLALAQQEVQRLQAQVKANSKKHLDELHQQLERAAGLAASDAAKARQIYRGIITLYGDKSWAADIVSTARSSLAGLDAP